MKWNEIEFPVESSTSSDQVDVALLKWLWLDWARVRGELCRWWTSAERNMFNVAGNKWILNYALLFFSFVHPFPFSGAFRGAKLLGPCSGLAAPHNSCTCSTSTGECEGNHNTTKPREGRTVECVGRGCSIVPLVPSASSKELCAACSWNV